MVYNVYMSMALKAMRLTLLLIGGILRLLAIVFYRSARYILKLERDIHL